MHKNPPKYAELGKIKMMKNKIYFTINDIIVLMA